MFTAFNERTGELTDTFPYLEDLEWYLSTFFVSGDFWNVMSNGRVIAHFA